jgi:hypothetical protein
MAAVHVRGLPSAGVRHVPEIELQLHHAPHRGVGVGALLGARRRERGVGLRRERDAVLGKSLVAPPRGGGRVGGVGSGGRAKGLVWRWGGGAPAPAGTAIRPPIRRRSWCAHGPSPPTRPPPLKPHLSTNSAYSGAFRPSPTPVHACGRQAAGRPLVSRGQGGGPQLGHRPRPWSGCGQPFLPHATSLPPRGPLPRPLPPRPSARLVVDRLHRPEGGGLHGVGLGVEGVQEPSVLAARGLHLWGRDGGWEVGGEGGSGRGESRNPVYSAARGLHLYYTGAAGRMRRGARLCVQAT